MLFKSTNAIQMKHNELNSNEYLPFYAGYINKSGAHHLLNGLEISKYNMISFLLSIPENKLEYQYAQGKWTIKEIVQHLIDAERVFSYRALRFARNDATALPGFDENIYVPSSKANQKSISALVEDYKSARNNTISLFNSFDDEMFLRIGIASGGNMSVRALGFVILGHQNHHISVIQERYL